MVDWALPHSALADWLADYDSVGRVRAALAAARFVRTRMPDAPTEELWADPAWLDALIEAVARWVDGEPVVVGVDSTRQLFAWSTDASVDGWIGECVDFTVQAIAPDPYRLAANHCSDAATNATLALIAAVRALEADGHADPIAAIRAVLPARIGPQ